MLCVSHEKWATALRNMTLSFSFYSEISDFSFLSKIISVQWGPPPASCSRNTEGCFPGGKAAGFWYYECVELYPHSPICHYAMLPNLAHKNFIVTNPSSRLACIRNTYSNLMVSISSCLVNHINTHCSNATLYYFSQRYMFRSKAIIIWHSLQNLKKQGKILLFARFLKYYEIFYYNKIVIFDSISWK